MEPNSGREVTGDVSTHRESIGRYEVLKPIDSRPAGMLYRGRDRRLRRDVMLKPLGGTEYGALALQRFEREAEVLSRLNHPNIAALYGVDTVEGIHYLVMEYVPGELLGTRIRRKSLEPLEVVQIGIQVAEGLLAAHTVGVIHRSISPESLWISEGGDIRLLGFGMSELEGSDSEGSELLEGAIGITGLAQSTSLAYMAPEMLRGKRATPLVDLYSVGTVLYRALTGHHLHDDLELGARIRAILDGDPPPKFHTEVPDELRRIVMRCLERSPGRRYQSASELLAALSGAVVSEVDLPEFLCDVRGRATLSPVPFVGCDSELAALDDALATANTGRGSLVMLAGEAGAGKSTLAAEFIRRAQAADPDLLVTMGTCNVASGATTPYVPFKAALALLVGDIEARCKAGTIEYDHAARLWRALPDTLALLATVAPDLIDVFVPGSTLVDRAIAHAGARPWLGRLKELASRDVHASATQSELFQQYARLLQRLSRGRTVLCFIDDLHWADQGSLGLLTHLVDEMESSHLLIIGTYRPEEVGRATGGGRSPLSVFLSHCAACMGDVEIQVGREHRRKFVDEYLDVWDNRFSEEFRVAFYQHTQGHALFVSEMLRFMRDEGIVEVDPNGCLFDTDLEWKHLPKQIEITISDRLERLPVNLRKILDVASVEGETFTAEIVARALDSDAQSAITRLSRDLGQQHRLVVAHGVRYQDGKRMSRYQFSHALIHKYVYQALDASDRTRWHEMIGTELDRLYGERTGLIAAELARHFEKAGAFDRAVKYLEAAGKDAAQASAYAEAIVVFERALRILSELPDDITRARRELKLQMARGRVLMEVWGYGSDSVLRAFGRAYELAVRLDEQASLPGVLMGLFSNAVVGADFTAATRWTREALGLDDSTAPWRPFAIVGWAGMSARLVAEGRVEEAGGWVQKLVDMPFSDAERGLVTLIGQDLRGAAMSWGATGLWVAGEFERAEAMARANFDHVRGLDHPASLAMALATVAHMFEISRDFEAVAPIARECAELSRRHHIRVWGLFAQFIEGDLHANRGDCEEGISEMEEACEALEEGGFVLFGVYRRVVMADALGRGGHLDRALHMIADAQQLIETRGDRFCASEVHRMHALLLDQVGGDSSRVARLLGRSVRLARRQGARALELRALCSLVSWRNLNGTANRRDTATKALGAACAQWSPTLDNLDLRLAHRLLSGGS